MDWDVILDSSAYLTTILIGTLGIFSVLIHRDTEKWRRWFYILFFLVIIIKNATNITILAEKIYLGNDWIRLFCSILNTLVSTAINPLLTFYILSCCREKLHKTFWGKLILILWGASVISIVVGIMTNTFFPVSESNADLTEYFMLPIYLAVSITGLIVNLIAVIRRRKQLSKISFIVILCYLLVPFPVTILIMELMMLFDQEEIYLKQKEEIARQKASLYVLQMRPHFIYNTMTSIYYLIDQDKDKAQQVILNFTNYLRKNFTAIANESTVPFSEELEHAQAYLYIEKVRFDGKLFIEFDTPYNEFKIPPLTLQPIVENAVKHGVDPDLEPLHIIVHTRKIKNGVEVIVEDTGPGFNNTDNNEPHIALNNIRERLKMMCGGKLTVSARTGGGTVVSIFIPDSSS